MNNEAIDKMLLVDRDMEHYIMSDVVENDSKSWLHYRDCIKSCYRTGNIDMINKMCKMRIPYKSFIDQMCKNNIKDCMLDIYIEEAVKYGQLQFLIDNMANHEYDNLFYVSDILFFAYKYNNLLILQHFLTQYMIDNKILPPYKLLPILTKCSDISCLKYVHYLNMIEIDEQFLNSAIFDNNDKAIEYYFENNSNKIWPINNSAIKHLIDNDMESAIKMLMKVGRAPVNICTFAIQSLKYMRYFLHLGYELYPITKCKIIDKEIIDYLNYSSNGCS
jgi:hypothetical protein